MDGFGVGHLAVAFSVVHDEDEAAFVANARDRVSASPLKLPFQIHAHLVADDPAQQRPVRCDSEFR